MESPALVQGSLERGDGCTIPEETWSSCANEHSSPIADFSCSSGISSGPISQCTFSPKTELVCDNLSVYHAADLLCSLRLGQTHCGQKCRDNDTGINCAEDCEENACKSVCSCAEAASESPTPEFISGEISHEIKLHGDADLLENDHTCLCEKGPKTDRLVNGVIEQNLASDDVNSATKRCRHATADSSSSARDYMASGCDVVFSDGIEYRPYGCDRHLHEIMELVSRDLSEPYSIYTYRYFIYNWPNLCFRALDVDQCVGAIVCKLHIYQDSLIRGYIAMLAVDKAYRRRGIGTQLVLCAIKAMMEEHCDDVVLEAEIDNSAALRLYENLGFIRDKRLHKYYLNGHDAFRLHLLLN